MSNTTIKWEPIRLSAPLRIAGVIGGFQLRDDRVGKGAAGTVATVIERDPIDQHCGAIDIDEAHRRAQLFAAAEPLSQAVWELLIAIDVRPAVGLQLVDECMVVRVLLGLAVPAGRDIVQRNTTTEGA